MRALFNQPRRLPAPTCPESLLPEARSAFDQGYALPLAARGEACLLIFEDVEDHADGNGLRALWMAQGSGRFYCADESAALLEGDLIVFDDRQEHGFERDGPGPCLALNFPVAPGDSPEAIRSILAQAQAHLLAPAPAPSRGPAPGRRRGPG